MDEEIKIKEDNSGFDNEPSDQAEPIPRRDTKRYNQDDSEPIPVPDSSHQDDAFKSKGQKWNYS